MIEKLIGKYSSSTTNMDWAYTEIVTDLQAIKAKIEELVSNYESLYGYDDLESPIEDLKELLGGEKWQN